VDATEASAVLHALAETAGDLVSHGVLTRTEHL
jgi:DNA-binding winged helix-turn-helix (wHTH) protein